MYTLYWAKGSGAIAPQAMLEEVGAPYEKIVIDIDEGEHQASEFLGVNPLGQIPALVLPDGTRMTESAAMVLHIADAHDDPPLIPPMGSPERVHFYRWLAFMATNIYMADLRFYYPERHTTDPGGIEGVKTAAAADLDRFFSILNDALDPGPFLLGTSYRAVDIYLWMLTAWHPEPERLLAENARIQKLLELVEARPAIARVRAEHAD